MTKLLVLKMSSMFVLQARIINGGEIRDIQNDTNEILSPARCSEGMQEVLGFSFNILLSIKCVSSFSQQ